VNIPSILNTFSDSIQAVIGTYAKASHLPAQAVIEFAVAQFLELDPTSQDADSLQTAIERYATEAELPSEMVVELAIAHFLDPDAVTFDDCNVGVQRDQVEQLRQYRDVRQTTAA
jgi:predicted transcriptional regulator